MTDSTDNAPRRIVLIQDDFLGGMWALASKDEADIAVHYIRALIDKSQNANSNYLSINRITFN